MKITRNNNQEIEIKYVKVELPIRYGEEDMPKDFPLRYEVPTDESGYDWWKATIEIDTGKILVWPLGKVGKFYIKVYDEGSYFLLDESRNIIAAIEINYVPNRLLPPKDGYGDYVTFKIQANGVISNWYKNPLLTDFLD